MEKAELRPLVLQVLSESAQTHFNAIEFQIRKIASEYKRGDALRLQEVVWELLVQGILAPGKNSLNVNLPFVHLTEYGLKCLEEDALLLHDPEGYMKNLHEAVGRDTDAVVDTYIRESLRAFLSGQLLASRAMIGIASCRTLDLLQESLLQGLADNKKTKWKEMLEETRGSATQAVKALGDGLSTVELPDGIAESMKIHLTGLMKLILSSQDDRGRPMTRPVARDEVHADLLYFPQLCKWTYDLIAYLNGENP